MKTPIPVGTIGRSPDDAHKKKTAAPLAKAAAAKAPCDALCDGKLTTNDRSAPCSNDPSFSISSDEFTAEAFEEAFPGQSVRAGMPNRMRRAMHSARGLIRAVERNDIAAAIVWMRALHSATAPLSRSKGAK